MLSDARQGSLSAILFHLAFWHMDLGYFGRGLLGSWPQADIGIVLWSLSVCAQAVIMLHCNNCRDAPRRINPKGSNRRWMKLSGGSTT